MRVILKSSFIKGFLDSWQIVLALISVLLISGCNSNSTTDLATTSLQPTQQTTASETGTTTETGVVPQSPLGLDVQPEPETNVEPKPELLTVSRVIDGDTIELNNGKRVTIKSGGEFF